jgi:hypothetical protein
MVEQCSSSPCVWWDMVSIRHQSFSEGIGEGGAQRTWKVPSPASPPMKLIMLCFFPAVTRKSLSKSESADWIPTHRLNGSIALVFILDSALKTICVVDSPGFVL